MSEGAPVIRRLVSGPVLDRLGTHPFRAYEGITYRQMRLRDGTDEEFFARVRAATSQMGIYRMILADGAGPIARIAREIVVAPPGAVVVHCHIGKDRTGLAIGMLLSAVGVTDEAVAADYALSADRLQPMRNFRRSLDGAAAAAGAAPPDSHLTSPPETMLALLAELRETHGGAAGYLRAGGLTDEELARLRRRLVD